MEIYPSDVPKGKQHVHFDVNMDIWVYLPGDWDEERIRDHFSRTFSTPGYDVTQYEIRNLDSYTDELTEENANV
jgi:hypothetical protein